MDIVQFINDVVKEIVDVPDDVDIECRGGEKIMLILIKVAKEDIGKIIGKHGRMITSIRTICQSLTIKQNKRVIINIIE